MRNFAIDGKSISVFSAVQTEAPIIYLNTFANEGQRVFEVAQVVGCPPFSLVAISSLDWNRDMAPWGSPAAFKKGEPFTGGADDYLRLLVEEIIQEAEKELLGPPAWRGIAGYSLAGLFALCAVYQTDVFSQVGCMSGSLWFPGFKEYVFFHDLRHTFATVALQSGVDVKTVSAMLGHYDAGFTLRTYTHTNRRMQEKAAEKMGNFMAQVL